MIKYELSVRSALLNKGHTVLRCSGAQYLLGAELTSSSKIEKDGSMHYVLRAELKQLP